MLNISKVVWEVAESVNILGCCFITLCLRSMKWWHSLGSFSLWFWAEGSETQRQYKYKNN